MLASLYLKICFSNIFPESRLFFGPELTPITDDRPSLLPAFSRNLLPTTTLGRQPSRISPSSLTLHNAPLFQLFFLACLTVRGEASFFFFLVLQPARLLPLSCLWADLPRSCFSRKTRRSQLYLGFETFASPSHYLTFYQHFLAFHAWFALLDRLNFTIHRLLTARPTTISFSSPQLFPIASPNVAPSISRHRSCTAAILLESDSVSQSLSFAPAELRFGLLHHSTSLISCDSRCRPSTPALTSRPLSLSRQFQSIFSRNPPSTF